MLKRGKIKAVVKIDTKLLNKALEDAIKAISNLGDVLKAALIKDTKG